MVISFEKKTTKSNRKDFIFKKVQNSNCEGKKR